MKANTQAAVRDLRVARSYLDEWYDTSNPSGDLVSRAVGYLEQARAKDPTASIEVADKKGRVLTWTADSMAAEALHIEASIFLQHASPGTLRDTRIALEKAVKFAPNNIAYRSKLADVYLDLYQRDRAWELAQQTVQLFPDNVDAIKLRDRIQAAPDRKPPTYFEKNPDLLATYGGLIAFAGIALSFFYSEPGVLLIIVGAVLYFWGRKQEKKQIADKAWANAMRKRGS